LEYKTKPVDKGEALNDGTNSEVNKLLAGVRVVELGHYLAAPAATAVMADWGADVLKIEGLRGDAQRRVLDSLGVPSGSSLGFDLANRGKHCVTLDLDKPGDVERIFELLKDADVFVTNFRVPVLERIGVDCDRVMRQHPHLVYALLTGYGDGRNRDRPSFDLGAFWATSGLAYQLTPHGAPPIIARGGIGDHVVALSLVSGILAAVVHQRATGQGALVETSLLRTGAYCLGWDLALQEYFGKVAPGEIRETNQSPLYNCYQTSDGGWLFVTIIDVGAQSGRFFTAIGREDLASDPRFNDPKRIRRNARELIEILDSVFARRPLVEWAELLDADGVYWAPLRSPADLLSDEDFAASGGFVEVERAGGGAKQRLVSSPITFNRSPLRVVRPGPQQSTAHEARLRFADHLREPLRTPLRDEMSNPDRRDVPRPEQSRLRDAGSG
jgi:crotonobetainyl-CoA:carnitine CoA-transferase CaiB-like acyl-CoA transferase